jgi:hypothetical protein
MVRIWSRNARLIDPEYSAKAGKRVKLESAVPSGAFGAVRAACSVVGWTPAAKLPSRIVALPTGYEGVAPVMRV